MLLSIEADADTEKALFQALGMRPSKRSLLFLYYLSMSLHDTVEASHVSHEPMK